MDVLVTAARMVAGERRSLESGHQRLFMKDGVVSPILREAAALLSFSNGRPRCNMMLMQHLCTHSQGLSVTKVRTSVVSCLSIGPSSLCQGIRHDIHRMVSSDCDVGRFSVAAHKRAFCSDSEQVTTVESKKQRVCVGGLPRETHERLEALERNLTLQETEKAANCSDAGSRTALVTDSDDSESDVSDGKQEERRASRSGVEGGVRVVAPTQSSISLLNLAALKAGQEMFSLLNTLRVKGPDKDLYRNYDEHEFCMLSDGANNPVWIRLNDTHSGVYALFTHRDTNIFMVQGDLSSKSELTARLRICHRVAGICMQHCLEALHARRCELLHQAKQVSETR